MLHVDGNFMAFWGHPASFLLRDKAGSWEGLGTLDGFPRHFEIDSATGGLWMVGSFTSIDGVPTHGMTRLGGEAPDLILSSGFQADPLR